MTFPSNLTDYLQRSVDKYSFSLASTALVGDTQLEISGGTSAFVVPCVVNINDELIKATTKTSTHLTGCTRGYGGTTATEQASGSSGYLPLTAEHYNELVDSKDAVIKFLCRNVASLPGSGEDYEVVEYGGEIYIYVSGTGWERIARVSSHDNMRGLDEGDPHPVYYTLSELESAHDLLSGGHVTGGDDHDHLNGQGFGAINTTTSRISTAPTYDGEIVLDTTTGELYVSYIDAAPATTDDWIKVTGAPSGFVMAFDPDKIPSSCPDGWTRYTTLDEKYIKGTSSSSQTTGGSETHSHDYDATDVVFHTHSVSSVSLPATSSHTHYHSVKVGGGGTSAGVYKNYTGSGGSLNSNDQGAHSHTGTYSSSTENTGDASPATESANGEPPYQKVIWCQKD